MKKQLFCVLGLLAAIIIGCDPIKPDPNPQPQDDTIPQKDTTDTIIPIPKVDTIRVDTFTIDSVVDLDNDMVVCSYIEWYFKPNMQPLNGLQNYVTHICFAFAELYVVDSVYQKFDLSGGSSSWTLFKNVLKLKEKNPDLKIQLSFSHVVENTSENSQGGGFSAMAKSQEQMSHFAHDCKVFCDTWGLDGVDIDWELPGISWSNHACDPLVDTENYTKLMKTLRDTLPFGDYLLTYAGYPKNKRKAEGGKGWEFVDNAAVEPYVDWINVMTYDLGSATSNTPHSAMSAGNADWDILRTYQTFNRIGFPLHKIVLGMPFYGRYSFDEEPFTYDYNKIEDNIKAGKWTRHYNKTWQTPYATDKSNKMMCSYDDEESIAYKAKWVKEKGLRGFMWWSQGGDTSGKKLTKACWNGLKKETQHWQYYHYHLSDSTMVVSDTIRID